MTSIIYRHERRKSGEDPLLEEDQFLGLSCTQGADIYVSNE